MKRHWMSICAVGALAAGCASEVELEYQSTLFSETRGLVLHDSGTEGHAAMWGTTCSFDVRTGEVLGDIDAPSETEEVHDVSNRQVLVNSPMGAFALEDEQWEATGTAIGTDARQVRFTETGVAALVQTTDRCSVTWADTENAEVVEVGTSCATDLFEVDPASGHSFVVADGQLLSVSSDGITELGEAPTTMAWNAATKRLFIGTEGVVQGLSASGDLEWEAPIAGGELYSMDDLGVTGAVAVTTRGSSASLTLLDGATGDLLADLPTPDVGRVAASRSGEYLGLVLRNEAHFFRVTEGGGPKVYTMTPEPSVFED